jgi:hypothetical protein
MKICSTEKDEVVDITESVDSGKDFFDTFSGGIRNTELYKKRMRHIIEYAVKHDLI